MLLFLICTWENPYWYGWYGRRSGNNEDEGKGEIIRDTSGRKAGGKV
jgi:hypothetical protein